VDGADIRRWISPHRRLQQPGRGVPITVIETLWALVALQRVWRRHRSERLSALAAG